MTKMTTEEAFIKVLQMHGIKHSFRIKGSPPAKEYHNNGPLCFAELTKTSTGSSPGSGLSKVSL